MANLAGKSDLVSIIIPVYNRAQFLDTCLESLLAQSWKQLEIIAVDDGSTDGSVEYLESIAKRDSRVRVILNQHGGAGKARNSGLRAARGSYFMFVDSDDYVDRRFVEIMVETLRREDADIVQCCYARVTDGISQAYVPIDREVCVAGWELSRMQVSFVGMYTPSSIVWNKIFRRELWDGIWFDEKRTFEDIFTSYQVIYPAKKIVLIPDVLYYWVIHGGSTSLADTASENCADIIRAWEKKTQYFLRHGEEKLAALNRKRCCYVSAQHIYQLKRNHARRDVIDYHYQVISENYPILMRDKRWSSTTRFRLHLIRLCPRLFGWYSKGHKLDFEK